MEKGKLGEIKHPPSFSCGTLYILATRALKSSTTRLFMDVQPLFLIPWNIAHFKFWWIVGKMYDVCLCTGTTVQLCLDLLVLFTIGNKIFKTNHFCYSITLISTYSYVRGSCFIFGKRCPNVRYRAFKDIGPNGQLLRRKNKYFYDSFLRSTARPWNNLD